MRKHWKVVLPVVVGSLILCFILAQLEILRRARYEIKLAREYLYNFDHEDDRNKKLKEKLDNKKITQQGYEFLMSQKIMYAEDGLKGALVSFQTVVEMFTPPHSSYVDESLAQILKISNLFFDKEGYILAKDGYETILRYTKQYGVPKGSGLTEADLKHCADRIPVCEEKIWPKKPPVPEKSKGKIKNSQ